MCEIWYPRRLRAGGEVRCALASRVGGQGGKGAPWEALGYDDHKYGGIEKRVTVTGRAIA